MAVALRENTEGGGGSQHPICTISRPVSESPRVGFWGRNPPAGRRRGRREGGSQRNRPKGPGEAAGREKPGREAPGAAPAQSPSVVSGVPGAQGSRGLHLPHPGSTRRRRRGARGGQGAQDKPWCRLRRRRPARCRSPPARPDRTTRRGDAPWGRRAHGTRRRLGPRPPPRTFSVRRSGRASSEVG